MKKIAIGVLSAGALAVATALVTSYSIGEHIQNTVEASIQNWSQADGLTIRLLRYERGVIHSDAQTLWSFTSGDEIYDITVNHSIVHGPWAKGQAAQVTSHFLLPQDSELALIQALQNQAPLQWTVTANWSGDTLHRLSSPNFASLFDDGSSLTWGGLTAQWDFNAQHDGAKGVVHMPVLRVKVPESHTIDIEDVKWDFDARVPAQFHFWTGPSSLQVGLLAMQDIESASHLKLQQVQLNAEADLEGEQLHLQLQGSAAKATSQSYDLDTLALHLNFRNLNAHWLEAMATQPSEAPDGDEVWVSLLQQLPLFLDSQPDLVLTRLSIHTPEGNVSASGRAHYQGNAQETDNPLRDLYLNLQGQAPKAILQAVLGSKVRSDYLELLAQLEQELDEPQLQRAIDDGTSKRLKSLVQLNAIRESGDTFMTELELKNGELTLNGQTRELTDLLQMGGAI